MRYITHHDTLVLSSVDGKLKYRFGADGVLDLGTGVTITQPSASPSNSDLPFIWDTDLSGLATGYLERVGQGSLTTTTLGTALTKLGDGFNRAFFEAPVINSGTATSAVVGVKYKVLTGTITYNSVSYTAGQTFKVVTGQTATSGGGTYALTIPDALEDKTADFRTEAFKIAHLNDGTEATGYYDYKTGYSGRGGLVSTAADYYGHL